jgi:hypothetical protein
VLGTWFRTICFQVREQYPADTFPVAGTMIGPGSLALFLGSEARLSDDTVWFEPCIDPDDPESHPPLRFDPDSPWWRITEETVRSCAELARGKYVVGCPDLVENIGICRHSGAAPTTACQSQAGRMRLPLVHRGSHEEFPFRLDRSLLLSDHVCITFRILS